MFGDEEEIGFVICASCGTRIKANRERCLRCEAPLVAWEKPELLPSWVQRLGGGTLVFGIVAVVVLLFVVATFVDWQSRTTDVTPRVSAANVHRAVGSLTSSGTSVASGPISTLEPVASLDAPGRGSVDLMRADFAALRTRYEEALEKKPADAELLNNLGLTLERLGQVDAAMGRFASAAQVDPRNWSYHFNLAHAASQGQDWDRAIAEYRLAAGLLPTDFATRYNLAMALHRKGDELGAIPELQKGIEMAPSVASFHLALGVTLEKVGRLDEAGRAYRTYLEMAPSAPDADRVRAHLGSTSVRPPS
jgi:Flp pilus assembly protein TadD